MIRQRRRRRDDRAEGHERKAFRQKPGCARGGSISKVLLVAAVLVGAAGGLIYVGRDYVEAYVLTLLAVLATVGVFALFAAAAGIMGLPAGSRAIRCSRRVVDGAFDGILVTDQAGRVVLCQRHLSRSDWRHRHQRCPADRAGLHRRSRTSPSRFTGLLKAAREGRRLQEEVRITARGRRERPLASHARAAARRERRDARLTVWSIADVTRERERQENVFQELQHAIDYLDHAPAGFFSVDAAGDIVYLNATLRPGSITISRRSAPASLKLGDIVAGEGAALLTTLNAAPGEVKTEVLDLDLKTRGGKPIPVRLFHKVAFGADGAPGTSRTLVLNRARDEGSDPQRAAEVRFMRFFQNTPMAIATVDKTGRIARSNARFASAFEGLLKSDDRSILSVVVERDRPVLEAAIRKAAEGQSDIAPVEAALTGSARTLGQFLRLGGRGRGPRWRGGDRLCARDHRAAHARKSRPAAAENGDPSVSWRAASPTISTTCSPPS